MEPYKKYLADTILAEDKVVSLATQLSELVLIPLGHLPTAKPCYRRPCQHRETVSLAQPRVYTLCTNFSGCSTNFTRAKMNDALVLSMPHISYMAS